MITVKELEHLAELSRVKLTEDDKKSLAKEFDSILGYIDQLKKVKISLEASQRVGLTKNVMRSDLPEKVKINDQINRGQYNEANRRQALLKEAPDREGDFVAVKKIIAQD